MKKKIVKGDGLTVSNITRAFRNIFGLFAWFAP